MIFDEALCVLVHGLVDYYRQLFWGRMLSCHQPAFIYYFISVVRATDFKTVLTEFQKKSTYEI